MYGGGVVDPEAVMDGLVVGRYVPVGEGQRAGGGHIYLELVVVRAVERQVDQVHRERRIDVDGPAELYLLLPHVCGLVYVPVPRGGRWVVPVTPCLGAVALDKDEDDGSGKDDESEQTQ